jgi:hypothetical protein
MLAPSYSYSYSICFARRQQSFAMRIGMPYSSCVAAPARLAGWLCMVLRLS